MLVVLGCEGWVMHRTNDPAAHAQLVAMRLCGGQVAWVSKRVIAQCNAVLHEVQGLWIAASPDHIAARKGDLNPWNWYPPRCNVCFASGE